MKNNFWNKRIPTLLGILLIVIGIGVTTFLVKQGGFFGVNASPTEQPQNVRITNITDNSFTISYTTADNVIGSINYGTNSNLSQTALDERDQQAVSSHKIHSIFVRNLNPETKYFFTITSGQNTYLNNNLPFTVTTGPKISYAPPEQTPISGKIILPDGENPAEAILYLTTDSAQVISALVKNDGSYILPLNSLRTQDLSSYYTLSGSTSLKILVLGDSLISNVQLSFFEASPVPTITLSKNYDFAQTQNPVATSSADLQSFPSFSSTSSASQNQNPAILNPKDNQGLNDQQPDFKGTALPNEKVQVIIHSSTQIQANVTSDSNGNWNYRPSTPLDPGTHTITIITKDSSGLLQTISKSFEVFAAGQQINPPVISTTPTPTVSPTETPTPTPIISSPTPTPTEIINRITPTPTPKILPPTGNSSIIEVGFIGVIVSLIGGLLLLLSKGSFSTI